MSCRRRRHLESRRRATARRGFTLVELLVAGVITAFILGSISMTLSNLGRSKSVSNRRLAAFLRADAALSALRRDVASIVRSDDLFDTRFLLTHAEGWLDGDGIERDELLIFNTRFRPLRDIDFHGEGSEYETQFRIEEDEFGPVLWVRRDALPDKYPQGGGIAEPLAEGIIGLAIEAYDGDQWHEEWESDEQGLPVAVRITVIAGGHRGYDDLPDGPYVTLRTVVPIDRILLPKDKPLDEEAQLIEEMQAAENEEALQNMPDPRDLEQTPGSTIPGGPTPGDTAPGGGPGRGGDDPQQDAGPARTLGGGS